MAANMDWDSMKPVDLSASAKKEEPLDWDSMKPVEIPEPAKEPPEPSIGERLKDIGVSAAKSVVGTGETAVGLADILSGGRAGKALEDIGADFPITQQILEEQYSPAQQAANRRVAEAKGFMPTVKAYLENPSVILHQGIQNVAPSVLTGGAIGQAALPAITKIAPKLAPEAAALIAGSSAEGLTAAAQNQEQVREESPTGLVTPKQTAYNIGAGIIDALITHGSGKIANKLGIGDLNTALINKGQKPIQEGFWNTLTAPAKEFFVEGVLQELPQSMNEQIAMNLAQNKPWDEGVAEQGAMGMIVGGATGAAHGMMPGGRLAEVPPPAVAPAPTGKQKEPEFAEVPEKEKEPIIVPPGGFKTEKAPYEPVFVNPEDEARTKNFVDRYQEALNKNIAPQRITPSLINAAKSAGVYEGTEQSPLELFAKVKDAIYPTNPVDQVTKQLNDQLDAAPVKGVANRAAKIAVANKQTPEQAAVAEQQLPEFPSPQEEFRQRLLNASDDELTKLAIQSTGMPEFRQAIVDERARREAKNASTIRSDTGFPVETRQIGEGGEINRGSDLYLAEQRPFEGSETATLGQGDREQEPQTLPKIEEPHGEGQIETPQERPPIEATPLEKARTELIQLTGTGDLNALRGPKSADARAKLLATLLGVDKVAKNKATNAALRLAFYEKAGIPEDTSAGMEKAFQEWVGKKEAPTPETPIDFAAHNQAAASPLNNIPEAAKPEDNRKAFTQFQDLPIEIENPVGSTRSGTDAEGKPWSVTMKDNYGAFTGYKGADKDNVDVFIPEGLTHDQIENTKSAFVIDQIDPKTGKFDEAKVMLGYPDEKAAKEAYYRNFEPGWQGLGAVTEMPLPEFKQWLASDKTAEPVNKELPQFSRLANENASWSEDRLKALMRSFAYTMNDNKTKALATWLTPDQFLKIATPSQDYLNRIKQESETLDIKRLSEETQPITLYGSIEGNKFVVDGHEGRHRMEALKNAGIKKVPVVLQTSQGNTLNTINDLTITGQDFGNIGKGKSTTTLFAIPINYANYTNGNLANEFSRESGTQFNRPAKQWPVSIESIPEDKRAGMRGLATKNAERISEQLAALTNAGRAYKGPLQFTLNEDKTFDLVDNSEPSTNAAEVNRKAASAFMSDFGASDSKSLFSDLDPAHSQQVREAALAQLNERQKYVEDNFYDMLLELEMSDKVKIKC